jgi:preprotein translocase subunit SecA
LHVIATERHEARRIDNQLRGRSGRQGDPGSSRFYVSLGDDLMRLFGSDRLVGIMDKLGLEEGQVIEHPWVSRSIEIAQRRVEAHNFEIRKQLLEYDNVMNKQREVIYTQRRQILEGISLKEEILEIIKRIISDITELYLGEITAPEEWDINGLINAVRLKFGLQIEPSAIDNLGKDRIKEHLCDRAIFTYEEKEKAIVKDTLRYLERTVFLQIIDTKWKEHLYAMDGLREGISLRAYGQRDPLIEYKREAFEMFVQMVSSIEETTVEAIFKLEPIKPMEFKGVFRSLSQEFLHPEVSKFEKPSEKEEYAGIESPSPKTSSSPQKLSLPKVGRNEPCPCGSGKKYKKCCGR